ncbi:MAG: hypothetical protein JXK07_15205 [Spirochaetes bacterium]|nr:hypothetical protein [Spirochaetota bacterium]MBN2769385.1 hypothetical protein [Spirochaetota bacterium]
MDYDGALEKLSETLKTFVPPIEGQFPKGVTSLKNPVRSEIGAIVYAPFRLCNWPEIQASPIPEFKDLNKEQKKLAELVCDVPGLPLDIFAIPQTVRARMRWLGREPKGLLEQDIEYNYQGELHTDPLWKAVYVTDGEVWNQLSLEQSLIAWGETVLGDYHIEPPRIPKKIGAAGKEWAPEYADWLLSVFSPGTPHTERGQYDSPPPHVRYVISSALAQAGVSIEERWDQLFTLDLKSIKALPQVRRDKLLIQLIGEERSRNYAAKVAMKAVKQFGTKDLLKGVLKYLAKPNYKGSV